MPLFHGIYSSSAPQDIEITICNSSTENRATKYKISQTSPWHHPSLPEIRPFSLDLQILIDDKQNLRYHILLPPPNKEPFNTSHLPTVSSIMPIRRCSGKAVIEKVHNAFGIQKLRDYTSGLSYTILTARFATHVLNRVTAPSIATSPKSTKTTPYIIRPAIELPRILASGDMYPLEYGSHSLHVTIHDMQFKKVCSEIYGWYMYSWPWLLSGGAQKSVRMKAQKDCQLLAQQCRWRNGGWLLDQHIQQFYCPNRLSFAACSDDWDITAYQFSDKPIISADPNDYIDGTWITDGLYKRARIALRRKYLMEFPWFELSSLKRKVEYDIGFLHMAWQLVGYPYMQSNNEENIHVETLQDKDIIQFHNADVYDLVRYWPEEDDAVGKQGRLQRRMEEQRPHINVAIDAMPPSWRKLMSLDE
ncbi:uncharacterized protein EAF01_003000 [Botrytis porri]|uniref:Uncharacterized protein n=1 Tax=Botrytis porri TaxID=87229 RepID=A0A4Z1K9I1_9HELO|nr:uncharacterized protein EAF01_003000 [Botrytis porri]KAF7909282.1 hypothetical protein EAF01_003000 [Botrytis porri]TGO82118.1 hypothetical protein BPOR_0918g00050 [Botrytis porri]